MSSTSQSIILAPGEFRIYTDVQLETPQVGLGTNEFLFDESPIIKNIYPNPSKGEVHIDFTIENKSNVIVSVYDLDGSLIFVLVNKEYNKGEYSITWDSNGISGREVNPGFYFCVVEAGGFMDVKTIVIK